MSISNDFKKSLHIISCNRLRTNWILDRTIKVLKRIKNRIAYEKEILVNSTKVVVLLSRNNLNFY